jgi:hypothetical protein
MVSAPKSLKPGENFPAKNTPFRALTP